MARQRDPAQGDPVVVAIDNVLNVEREGVQRLQRGRDRAQNLLTEARAGAAAIAKRADACIVKLHNSYLQKVERDIDTLGRSNASTDESDRTGNDRAKVARAVERLAAKLTGGA